MSYEATEEDLRRLFSVAGTVQSVHLITDPVTGQSKGCGYVKMKSQEEAKEAIDCLDGALLIDRVITVSEAKEQKPQAAKSRAGGYRGTSKPAAAPVVAAQRRPVKGKKPSAAPAAVTVAGRAVKGKKPAR
jgi:RNA recognition motif-containing protein